MSEKPNDPAATLSLSQFLFDCQSSVPVKALATPFRINHPSHYTDGKIEVIDFIEDKKLGFYLGNAVKYIFRAGKKDPDKEIEDLEKAIWYVNRRIKQIKDLRALDVPKKPADGYCYGNRKDE